MVESPPVQPVVAPRDRETLDDIAAELAGVAAEAAAPPAPEPPPQVPEPLALACSALCGIIGGMICARADRPPLTAAESDGLGRALAGVAVFYLPAEGDPRFMAWATLGLALGSVVAPRLEAPKDARPAAGNAPIRGNIANGLPLP